MCFSSTVVLLPSIRQLYSKRRGLAVIIVGGVCDVCVCSSDRLMGELYSWTKLSLHCVDLVKTVVGAGTDDRRVPLASVPV